MMSRSDSSNPRMSDVMPTMAVMPMTTPRTVRRRAQLVRAQRVERHATTNLAQQPGRGVIIRASTPQSDRGGRRGGAGYAPKNNPTIAVMPMPSTTDHGSRRAGSGVTVEIACATSESEDDADEAADMSTA